jgi:RNA polymerase sigma factor (sigma-70 family)
VEVSALKYSGGLGLQGRSPLLRLQSDERLVHLVRRGSDAAFEVLVARYNSRLLAFCRHMLGSREDAEDVLQDVMAAAYNAILADERPINVRPWLYRIARNRSLNHLRRATAVGMDSMDVHLHDHGTTTADLVHEREEFRLLVVDIQRLPETQRTALVLREMDALSYEQIAEAMETTVPSIKSLLVRARIGLAEAAEARALSCAEVRIELGEVAEGILRKPSPLVRRHLKTCTRCASFQTQLKDTSKSLALLLPLGPLALLRKLVLAHLGHSAGSSAGAAASSSAGAAASSTAAGGAGAAAGGAGAAAAGVTSASSLVSAGVGALAGKAAVGIAAAALVAAGAVEVDHAVHHRPPVTPPLASTSSGGAAVSPSGSVRTALKQTTARSTHHKPAKAAGVATTTTTTATTTPTTTTPTTTTGTTTTTTVDTVLPPSGSTSSDSNSSPSTGGASASGSGTTTSTTPTTTTPTTTTTSPPPNQGQPGGGTPPSGGWAPGGS